MLLNVHFPWTPAWVYSGLILKWLNCSYYLWLVHGQKKIVKFLPAIRALATVPRSLPRIRAVILAHFREHDVIAVVRHKRPAVRHRRFHLGRHMRHDALLVLYGGSALLHHGVSGGFCTELRRAGLWRWRPILEERELEREANTEQWTHNDCNSFLYFFLKSQQKSVFGDATPAFLKTPAHCFVQAAASFL